MTATAAMRNQVRRWVNELTTANYSDDQINDYIEKYPLLDERGELPYEWNPTTTPPSKMMNGSWVPTYDLHAAAADIWEEKVAAVVGESFDFSADGGNFSRSQSYEQMAKQVRYHRARRSTKTSTMIKFPDEDSSSKFPWIGNLPEDDG